MKLSFGRRRHGGAAEARRTATSPVIRSLPRVLIPVFFALSLLSCQAKVQTLRPALEEDGEVFLYLRRLPQEAERFRFSLGAVHARRDDGSEIPLVLSLSAMGGPDDLPQSCLAAGQLPPGSYRGLSFSVAQASLATEDGTAALRVPEAPVSADGPFIIRRGRATLLTVSVRPGDAASGVFRFDPSFAADSPGRQPAGIGGYVSHRDGREVTVIDKTTGEVTGMTATGSGPRGLAVDAVKGRVYAALSGDDAVDVIDAATGDVIGRVQLRRGDNPGELALVPGSRTLLAANAGSDTVSFIDTGSLMETERVTVGQDPGSILPDDGGRAYVFNALSNTISALDVSGRSVVATLSTDPEPLRGQFNRRGDRLYVIHGRSPYLTVIDPRTLTVVRREFIGMGAVALKVDSRTDMLYIARRLDDGVSVYDPLSFQRVDYIRTGGAVEYMTIDGEGNNLLVLMPEKKALKAINLVSRRTVHETDLCGTPYRISVMGER